MSNIIHLYHSVALTGCTAFTVLFTVPLGWSSDPLEKYSMKLRGGLVIHMSDAKELFVAGTYSQWLRQQIHGKLRFYEA